MNLNDIALVNQCGSNPNIAESLLCLPLADFNGPGTSQCTVYADSKDCLTQQETNCTTPSKLSI